MSSSSNSDDSREKIETDEPFEPENSAQAFAPNAINMDDATDTISTNTGAAPTAASFMGEDVDEYLLHPELPPTQIEQYLELDEDNAVSQAARASLLAANGSFVNGAVGGLINSMMNELQRKSFEQFSSEKAESNDGIEDPAPIEKIGE